MYNITLPILGTRLKQIREHIGYSQAQLAEQLNCKQNAISNLELGKGAAKTFISSAEFFILTMFYRI